MFKQLVIIINLVTFLGITNCFAAIDPNSTISIPVSDEVVFLKKGSVTNFDGYLFSQAKAEDLRIQVLEKEKYRLLNESLTTSLELYKQNLEFTNNKLKLLEDQNDKLAQQLQDARSSSDLSKIIIFSLGMLMTGVAFFGVAHILVLLPHLIIP